MDVNANTVLRGYRQLRDEGLVELRRGRGATITATALDRSRLLEAVDRLVAEARRLGMSTPGENQMKLLWMSRAASWLHGLWVSS